MFRKTDVSHLLTPSHLCPSDAPTTMLLPVPLLQVNCTVQCEHMPCLPGYWLRSDGAQPQLSSQPAVGW